MNIEFRTVDGGADIFDERGQRVGFLLYVDPDALEEGDDPEWVGWVATVGDRSSVCCQTAEEAVLIAHQMYDDLVEDRKRENRFHRSSPTRVVSVPMGGQPK